MVSAITYAPFFTQRVTPDLATKILSIAGKTSHFTTDFMGRPEDSINSICVRLEALQNPATGLWQIDRFTHLPDEIDVIHQETEAKTGLCFFDALHYLARFQKTEEELGKQPVHVPGERWTTIQHYKQAAEESGQAIDIDGEIHPTVSGQILTNKGFFTAATYQRIAETKKQPLAELALRNGESFFVTLTKELMKNSIDPTDQNNNPGLYTLFLRQDLTRNIEYKRQVMNGKIDVVTKAGSAFDQAFRAAGVYRFKSTFINTPFSALKLTLRRLKSATSDLPDSEEKSLLKDFAKAASYAIAIERAACFYAERKNRGKPPVTFMGLHFIQKAAAIVKLSPLDTERLKNDYRNGHIYESGARYALEARWLKDIKPHLDVTRMNIG